MNYINELPPEYQERANTNILNMPSGELHAMRITHAFRWNKSPEGYRFWQDVYNAKDESQLPKLPNDV